MDYLFDFPRDLRDWMRAQDHFQPDAEIHAPPIIAKDQKDVPDWLKHHQWEPAVDVNKLKKYQLKVKLCCSKCAEKVVEEILEVYGVFDVRAEHLENKVVVVATPNGLDEHEVLLKARKIHRKAKFVELDAKEKPKDNKKKQEDGEKGKGDNEGNKQGNKGNKELQANSSQSKSTVVPVYWPSWPISSNAPRFLYPPSHILHYPNPHGQLVQFL